MDVITKAEGGADSQHQHSGAINPTEVAKSGSSVTNLEGPSKRFRAKQPIRRRPQRSSS
ncbi:hypothetical protein PIB30_086727 [Stylosanthes scabra]|uniref:Uncharacterized protein n=1 Tax=Stylosanthes scabra TaxID=79078 RepID=A0ABU6RTD8_9FABA|nr:hypothetical protein [Stylosanthes scabra]